MDATAGSVAKVIHVTPESLKNTEPETRESEDELFRILNLGVISLTYVQSSRNGLTH